MGPWWARASTGGKGNSRLEGWGDSSPGRVHTWARSGTQGPAHALHMKRYAKGAASQWWGIVVLSSHSVCPFLSFTLCLKKGGGSEGHWDWWNHVGMKPWSSSVGKREKK